MGKHVDGQKFGKFIGNSMFFINTIYIKIVHGVNKGIVYNFGTFYSLNRFSVGPSYNFNCYAKYLL